MYIATVKLSSKVNPEVWINNTRMQNGMFSPQAKSQEAIKLTLYVVHMHLIAMCTEACTFGDFVSPVGSTVYLACIRTKRIMVLHVPCIRVVCPSKPPSLSVAAIASQHKGALEF